MKLKKFAALLLAALTCIMALTVSVSAAKAKNSIKLDKTTITLEVGETAVLKPSAAKKCTIQWSSSDKSVATVKKGGKVTAKKEGTAKITVKIKNTDYKAVCKVTVVAKSGKKDSSSKKDSGSQKQSASKTSFKSGQALLDKMTVGWNLGNSLDSLGSGLGSETAWGNPKTTKAMIDAVKNAGFNTVRIPTSWGKHMDKDGKVDSAWMDRVQEVVDYAYDNGMYVILNSHHDNEWLKLTEAEEKETTKKYAYLWKQIAERFADYDEKLIFEGRNEPRTIGSAKEWTGGTPSEREVINRMYEAFVDAVRNAGGNNKTRYLIVAPYAASSSYEPMAALKIPDDDRIIVAIHAYIPYMAAFDGNLNNNTLTESGKKEIDTLLNNIDKLFTSKGIPVIIDEFGSVNKNNTDERIKMAEYFVSEAGKQGIPLVWWDNNANKTGSENFGLLNRSTCEWYYPELVKALVDTAKAN